MQRIWRVLFAAVLVLPLAAAVSVPALDDAAVAPRPALPGGAARSGAGAAASGDDAEYAIGFRCPEVVDGPTPGAPVCPSYVLDREDIFGQPVLLVDARNPNVIGFSAMHGGRGLHAAPGDEPPSHRSRDDGVHQPHTTFLSRDGGARWEDMPYHAPDSMRQADPVTGQPRNRVYGEDNAAALDGEGRLHLAALYASRPAGGPTTGFAWSVGLWKSKTLDQPVDYHVNLKVVPTGENGARRADSLHMTHVPGTDLTVLQWRESGEDNASLVYHWTRSRDGAMWTRQEADAALGDCRSVSNPLAHEGVLYVACLPNEEGNQTVRVLAIDVATWSTSVAGEVGGVEGERLILAARGDHGYMVLVASGLREDGSPTVSLSYGEKGGRWSSSEELAHELTLAPGAPLLDARVTAAAFSPISGSVHLIYLERHDLASANQDRASAPEYTKVLGSVQAEGPFLGRVDLGLGALNRVDFSPTLTGVGSGAFDDLHDGIVVWRDTSGMGRHREFVAYGDHGYVRFAEVVEENFPIPIVPLGGGAPPVPLATPGSLPVLVGLPAGLLAGAMVVRTLAARRKVAVEVKNE